MAFSCRAVRQERCTAQRWWLWWGWDYGCLKAGLCWWTSQHAALHVSFSVSESLCFLWCFTQESQITFKLLFCSDKFTRFCQWKNVELNIHVSTYTYIYLVKGWCGEESVQFWILLLKRPYRVQGVLLIRCSILRHAVLTVPSGHPFCLPWADGFGIAVIAARSWAAPIVSPSLSHCSCSSDPSTALSPSLASTIVPLQCSFVAV